MCEQPDAITRLVRACHLGELAAGDDRYVDCDDVRGDKLVDNYARSLRHADPSNPLTRVFAGHMGVGKSTELLRLKKLLEQPQSESNPSRPFKVIYFDVRDTLDLNDLDFPDLLVCIAGEIYKQLGDANIPGFTGTSILLKNVWDRLKGLLQSEVGISADIPFTPLAIELKNNATARQKLRADIDAQSTNLLGAVNDLLQDATVKLREAEHEGLVLIVDGLEKVVLRRLPDGTTTHDRLFVNRGEQLASLKAHVIYAVPISLIYSPQFAQLVQAFREQAQPIPMIRIRPDDRSEITSETPGMKKMWEIVEKRCQYADVDIADVFDEPETGHYLCRMSGGHPRHLLMFITSAANLLDELPITLEKAESAVGNYATGLLRNIPDEYWEELRKFNEPTEDMPKDEDHLAMLFLLHIFEYMNAHPWYEVNPALRTLDKFNRVD